MEFPNTQNNMNTQQITITPEWAKRVIETQNTKNRTINSLHVNRLAKAMKDGVWIENGDTICFSGDTLVDGQHRLHAVVKSGIPIKCIVVYGLPAEAFETKDIGKRRSHSDTLSACGQKNTNRLSAALILIGKYMSGWSELNIRYTNQEILGLLDEYPDLPDSISSQIKRSPIMFPSVMDACYYLFSKKDRELADQFIDKVVSGSGLSDGSPWLALRERLMKNSLSKSKLPKEHIFALCIKSWNAARMNRPVKHLNWRTEGERSESFPVIL